MKLLPKRWLIILLLCLSTLPLAQAAAPLTTSATYNLFKSGQQVGIVTETFSRKGSRYEILSETKAVGIFALFAKGNIKLISRGEVTKDGLRPLHFEHHRGADPDKLIVADFDWRKHILTMNYDGKTETAALTPGTQDRISRMYQFMFAPPHGKELAFPMTNGRNLELYRYLLADEAPLDTAAGKFNTLHYSKQHKPDEDGTELWLASDHHHFPVRILIEESEGGKLEQKLTQLKFK